jgi:hypothetical protein
MLVYGLLRVQIGSAARTDCILAETFLRLDHLEGAIHKVKHEELINGIMMRLEHMQTEMAHIEEQADDKIEEKTKQADFKDQVR